MQAIQTKYLPATNLKGSRIKATCDRGSITISYPNELSGDAAHIAAVDALIAKFVKEDEKRYGTNKNPWSLPRVCGGLPDNSYVHVFVETGQKTAVLEFEDATDKERLAQYVEKAKAQEGTVAPLWNGLLCSALKRSTLVA